jgi:hypothetical protein
MTTAVSSFKGQVARARGKIQGARFKEQDSRFKGQALRDYVLQAIPGCLVT